MRKVPTSKTRGHGPGKGDLNCLLVGASGFLGRRVGDELVRRGVQFIGTCRRDNSAASSGYVRYSFPRDSVSALARVGPVDCAIICARLAEPSLCDERSFAAKFDELLASIRGSMRDSAASKIVYVSSDAVFSGKKGRYVETDVPRPATEDRKSVV